MNKNQICKYCPKCCQVANSMPYRTSVDLICVVCSLNRGVKYGIQIGSDWPQMGQIWDFFDPKCTETGLKDSQICPIWGQSDPIWMPYLTPLSLKPTAFQQAQIWMSYWTEVYQNIIKSSNSVKTPQYQSDQHC